MTWNLHDIFVFEAGRRKEDDPYREDITTDEQYFAYVDEILVFGNYMLLQNVANIAFCEVEKATTSTRSRLRKKWNIGLEGR